MKTCPRCHQETLDEVEVRNALSRRTRGGSKAVYVCSPCGTEEAMLDAGLATYLENEHLAVRRDLEFQAALGITNTEEAE